MKRPIGIVELYQHNEVLIHYCDLLLSGNNQLYVFCNKLVFEDLPQRLKTQSIVWLLNDSEKNISKFIKKNEASFKECPFLLITTVFSHFNAFTKLASWCNTALIIHSAHTWFNPFKFVRFRKGQQLADVVRLFKFIILRQSSDRKKLLKNLRYIGLPNTSILNYIQSNFERPGKAELVSIPFAAYIGLPDDKKDETMTTFTITGSIGDDVRDYKSVLKAIQILLPKLDKKIKLVLLGKPISSNALLLQKEFESIIHPKLQIITFTTYISQNDFENYLFKTDYLILPLKKYTQFYVFQELTCYSKLSGSVNDMIRYGIPALATQNCTIDEKVDAFITYYENPTELADKMLELSATKKPSYSRMALKEIFSHHLKEKLYQNLIELIDD